jgi:hypothetical protein
MEALASLETFMITDQTTSHLLQKKKENDLEVPEVHL